MAQWHITKDGPLLVPGGSPDCRDCETCGQARWKCFRDGHLFAPLEEIENPTLEVVAEVTVVQEMKERK